MKNKLSLLIMSLCVIGVSCRKKPDPVITQPEPVKSAHQMTFTFKNLVGNQSLSLGNTWYLNQNLDSFKVTMYKYYVTNIILTKDGTDYEVPESYYLVDESKPETKSFTIKDLPVGEYSKITFMIGVDTKRNTSGAQTGFLDPSYGMIWDWNTGYIMAKMEGISPQSSIPSKVFQFHMGGFKFPYPAQRIISLDLPKHAPVSDSAFSTIIVRSDVLEWFKTPTIISLAQLNAVMEAGKDVQIIADNYVDMFSVEDVVIAEQ
jgi:hypothetical protein